MAPQPLQSVETVQIQLLDFIRNSFAYIRLVVVAMHVLIVVELVRVVTSQNNRPRGRVQFAASLVDMAIRQVEQILEVPLQGLHHPALQHGQD